VDETIFEQEYDLWRLELNATDTFLAMWSTWVEVVPPALVGEDPDILLRLLDLADVVTGISQTDLQLALNVGQSKLSKLTSKLIKLKWLEEVRRQAFDRRCLFVRTGRGAKSSILALETRFSTMLVATRKTGRSKGPRVANALGNLLDGL
jgi:hypothetical protein